jgi:ribosomal protein S18 acetylase RimI-like enzyme
MMKKHQNPTSKQQIEQYSVEPDYSDPSGDDFDALSRDKVMIRSLTPEDLDPVVRIDQKITGNDHRAFFQRKFQEVLFESGVRISLVAEVDGMVVGFMMARVDFGEFGRTASEAVIDMLGVARAFRSQQVGHALLSQLLTNLASLQVESVRSEVEWNNFGLLGFLESCGFVPSQRLALSCNLSC